jgi:diguanylate cyclase (GGDEF)-like protein
MGLLHFWARFGELDSNRLQLIRILADSISLAFSNLKMKEDLLRQSIRDPLTQLFNRRYMEETLQLELARSERMESPLAIIMGDIDHFKSFNDKYGHLVGDQILQQVSAVMESNIRNGDVACRYGGEEFILILPGAPLESALQRAEFCVPRLKGHHLQRMVTRG